MTGRPRPDDRDTGGSGPKHAAIEPGVGAVAADGAGGESQANLDAEVRTALQSIVGGAYLLQSTPLTAEQRQYLDYISGAAENLEGAVAKVTSELAELAGVASRPSPASVQKILATAREVLGMEVAFASRITEEQMTFRALAGDASSFG